MQLLAKAVFGIALGTIAYVYVVYPLVVSLLANLRRPRGGEAAPGPIPAFSVVLVVHNEAARISGRLDELVGLIEMTGPPAELIVVTDGCTDSTATMARAHPSSMVRVIELPDQRGKAYALSLGCQAAQGDVLVLADARQRWATDALRRLLGNFNRPEVGAVGGQLVIENAAGVLAGVGLYWRYEKWLRRNEAQLHSTVGVSGSICAVRRNLFQPVPCGVLLDDLYWPLLVVMQGWRVVYEEFALAYDHLPERAADEFGRKVRTLSGNFQLAAVLPQALLPWRNPIWMQFVSHKLLRLLVPWMLLALLLTTAVLQGPLYRVALVAQILFYGVALLALMFRSRWRLATAAGSFVVLNAAAWLGFWVWICGRTEGSWKKVAYDLPLPPD